LASPLLYAVIFSGTTGAFGCRRTDGLLKEALPSKHPPFWRRRKHSAGQRKRQNWLSITWCATANCANRGKCCGRERWRFRWSVHLCVASRR